MTKKLVIFGATGGTGRELVKQAIEDNYSVTAFVRNPKILKNLPQKNLTLIKGDVLNPKDVNNAVRDQNIVLCSLGMPASDKSTLRADGTGNIIQAMQMNKVDRLICQTSLGFGDSKEVLPWHMKYIIVPFILKNAFKDHELQEQKIEESDLAWTIVRPGNMTNGSKTGNFKHGFRPNEKIKLKVSRADVAHFMLEQIKEEKYIHKKVGISY